MLKKSKEKTDKVYLPTESEMLGFKPMRSDYEWKKNTEGLIEIKIPKFNGNFGKSFCKFIKKDNHFTAKMDRIGSTIWINADGNKTVKEIFEILKKEYPDEKNINQRLYLFLQQMKALNYINF